MIRDLSIAGARVIRAVVDDGQLSNFVLELELPNGHHVCVTVTACQQLHTEVNQVTVKSIMNLNIQPRALIGTVIPWMTGAESGQG